MKQAFTDRASFLKAAQLLRDGLFVGPDLVFDKAAGTLELTLTCPDSERAGGLGAFLPKRPVYRLRSLSLKGIRSYRQSLTSGLDEVYVFDRAEVERAGTELTLYFRPGDRAVMDVEHIDGTITDAGRATTIPKKPANLNPLAARDARQRR